MRFDLIPPGAVVPQPDELLPAEGAPDTIDGWKELADGLLSERCCSFHRNAAISSRYAWLHACLPACFKWAAMAAIASHHVRLALYPLRLRTDAAGEAVPPRAVVSRRALLTEDVHTIRATNNAIYEDVFWVHLAYLTADDGLGRLRVLLGDDGHYGPVLAAFDAIDRGCRVLDDATSSDATRRQATEDVWTGNVALLEHEQRAVVQPRFDLLSCTTARLLSLGSVTSFEVRGVRREVAYFTSFSLHHLRCGIPMALRQRSIPRITSFDDRWRWLDASVVPRFRLVDADQGALDAGMRRIFDVSRRYEAMPCIPP